LSKKTGTKDVAEKLAILFNSENISIDLVSNFRNKILRISHIFISICLTKSKNIFFDVFSGQAFLITQIGSFIAKNINKKVILTLRGGALQEFSERNEKLVKQVFNRADYIQTPSLFLKQYFEQLGFTIHYLPNPINFENFKYDRREIIPYSILWVRAFATIYNPDLAIDIFYEIKRKYPKATLTMVGPDKGLLSEIRQQIIKFGLSDSVNIVGPVTNNDLHKYYQSHHVYINTTSYESFGMAIVEAAACGIPIVSTSVGEIPYLWTNEKNMMLIDSFDAKDFCFAVSKIFDNEGFAKSLSENAKQNVEQFDWKYIEPKWIKLLTNKGNEKF
jgi:glycosyltransferase involved in cell wall biosynthesis